MDAVGVICEYNPFHLGHARHLQETRRASGADAVVCVMSGVVVQRGELPLLSESARAEAAVRCGADLVLALPLPWSVASAERFAIGGVSILARLGNVSALSFGSESGDAERLSRVAAALDSQPFLNRLGECLKTGISYAAARQMAAEELIGEEARCLREPNDTLAAEYLRAAASLGWESRIFAVRREDTHDGDGLSAKRIREMVYRGEDTSLLLPTASEAILRREIAVGRAVTDPGRISDLVLARLRQMTDEDYRNLPDGSEGLWMRLARYGRTEPTLDAVLEKTKTKRYAYARLRRMVLCAYLGVSTGDAENIPMYTRVLALNDTGRRVLRESSRIGEIPIVTRPAEARRNHKEFDACLEMESRGTDLRALAIPSGEGRRGGGFWRTSPVYVET